MMRAELIHDFEDRSGQCKDHPWKTFQYFYGDVEKAIISPEERYCVMVGCGIIVYFLSEPFNPYEYDRKCSQWKEWYKIGDIWIQDVMLENNGLIEIQMENGKKEKIQIDVA